MGVGAIGMISFLSPFFLSHSAVQTGLTFTQASLELYKILRLCKVRYTIL